LHFGIGNFYQIATDPEYSILFNGAVIGRGSLAINFIDHPATPLIYISGIAIRICHLFTGSQPYVLDFVNNTEKYLHIASILNLLIIGSIVYWSGRKLLRHNNGLLIALLLQVTLFTNTSLIEISARLIPESTMIIPIILLSVLLINYFKNESKASNYRRLSWQFAAIIAFGIACKLSFAPMILLPIILLRKNFKTVLQLIGKTILLTFLFAYPLITNPNESFEWISNMLIHSGKHGTGDTGFINTSNLTSNFIIILKRDIWFWVLFLSQFTLSQISNSKRLKKVSAAITCSLITVLFFTLKHFALHYIMPFYAFKSLFIILIIYAIQENKKLSLQERFPMKFQLAFFALLTSIIWPQLIDAKNHYDYTSYRKILESEIQSEVFNKIQNSSFALIVDAPHWGTPFPEYAKAYGFMNTHRRKTTFKNELRKIHPNFYCYVSWSEGFNHWDKFVGFDLIFNHNKSCYLYSNRKIGSFDKIIKRLKDSGITYKLLFLYENIESGECLVKIDKYVK
jgi:hypothetical protein